MITKRNRFHVDERVRIIGADDEFKGLMGRIYNIDGEYHYVKIWVPDYKEFVELELYRGEMEKIQHFEEDLFHV